MNGITSKEDHTSWKYLAIAVSFKMSEYIFWGSNSAIYISDTYLNMVNPLREEFAPADVNFFLSSVDHLAWVLLLKRKSQDLFSLVAIIGGKERMGFQARA